MNPLYQQLARTLEDIGRRVEQLQARYGEAQDESPTVAGKIRQAVANVQSGIQQLQGMLTEAAEKTTDGVPAAWDLVAVVPADQADPEAVEGGGPLPEARRLGEAFGRGMDGFEQLKELIKTYSDRPLDVRQVWAEEVERLGKEFHRVYQLSRQAHDANWHDDYY